MMSLEEGSSDLQACPCTNEALCRMDNINAFNQDGCHWNGYRPGSWYFIHGGDPLPGFPCRATAMALRQITAQLQPSLAALQACMQAKIFACFNAPAFICTMPVSVCVAATLHFHNFHASSGSMSWCGS